MTTLPLKPLWGRERKRGRCDSEVPGERADGVTGDFTISTSLDISGDFFSPFSSSKYMYTYTDLCIRIPNFKPYLYQFDCVLGFKLIGRTGGVCC